MCCVCDPPCGKNLCFYYKIKFLVLSNTWNIDLELVNTTYTLGLISMSCCIMLLRMTLHSWYTYKREWNFWMDEKNKPLVHVSVSVGNAELYWKCELVWSNMFIFQMWKSVYRSWRNHMIFHLRHLRCLRWNCKENWYLLFIIVQLQDVKREGIPLIILGYKREYSGTPNVYAMIRSYKWNRQALKCLYIRDGPNLAYLKR